MAHSWRKAREEQERDIKKTLQRAGLPERIADDFARRRAQRGMERAVNIAHQEGTSSPTEVR